MSADENLLKAKKLLRKYQEGACTEEEKSWVENWYLNLNTGEADLAGEPLAEDLKELQERLQAITGQKRRFLFSYIATAAILTIAVGLGWRHFTKKADNNTQQMQQVTRIPAGTNKATLTLGNGQQINLDDSGNGTIAQQSGSVIQKAKGGLLVYHQGGNSTDTTMKYNTVTTPRGGQYQLQLADGTKVWLNAASSLKYPAKFIGKRREVILTGEGYFEIAHSKAHPFIIKTEKQETEDLGTSFNINSYSDEPNTITTLVDGSVMVHSANGNKQLKPGQQSVLNTSGFSVSDADLRTATAWKKGYILFRKAPIKKVLREISRWYNIDIEYKGTEPDYTITGGTPRNADLSAILKILQLSDVHYEQQGRKLIITN